jgi:hypothetical protein
MGRILPPAYADGSLARILARQQSPGKGPTAFARTSSADVLKRIDRSERISLGCEVDSGASRLNQRGDSHHQLTDFLVENSRLRR